MCAQIGAYTWPALLPGFLAEWHLTNREAGWITGIFYAAYTVSVPVLVTLTDRVDARAVYLSGVALTVASHLGFAAFVDGPWGAAAARALAGVGWAGTYMTGLKLLADRVEPVLMSRAVAGHAASIGIAGAMSFVFAGTIGRWLGWRGAFAAAAVAAIDRLADRVPLGAGAGAPPGHRGLRRALRLPAGASQSLGHGLRRRLLRAHVGDERAARLGGRVPGLRGGRDRRRAARGSRPPWWR